MCIVSYKNNSTRLFRSKPATTQFHDKHKRRHRAASHGQGRDFVNNYRLLHRITQRSNRCTPFGLVLRGGKLDKKKLSEADIGERFITPALQQAGWGTLEQIFREYTLRPGRVVVRGHKASRDKKSVLRADYVLF